MIQDLMLMIGYAFRADAAYVLKLSRTSAYINAVSNRLSASSTRAQFLGMILGSAVSELVHPTDQQMRFTMEELNDSAGLWYKSLISTYDQIGSIHDLKVAKGKGLKVVPKPEHKPQNDKLSISANNSKIIAIEELDDTDSEDDDLPVYEKPDSDAEDSDDDPTTVQRNKPTAPVYVSLTLNRVCALTMTKIYSRPDCWTAKFRKLRYSPFGYQYDGELNTTKGEFWYRSV